MEPKYLKIANSRGRKQVLTAIKKAGTILQDLLIEITECEGKRDIKKCTYLLFDILEDNKQEKKPVTF